MQSWLKTMRSEDITVKSKTVLTSFLFNIHV